MAQSFRISNLEKIGQKLSLLRAKNLFYYISDFAYEVKKCQAPQTMIICLQEQNWILSGFLFTPKYCFTLFYVFVRFLSNTNISNFYQYKWSDWYFWTPMIMSNQNIIIRGQFTSMRVKVSSRTVCACLQLGFS